jgi:two-component system sensor histidine kinase/response regulator
MQDAMAHDQPHSAEDAVTRLMVVEDEFVIACDLCDALEKLGYTVVASVGSGEEAVEIARTACPSAILMDIRLAGEMDGVQAAAQIRSEVDIPIVFLSAHSSEETVRRATDTGPFGYLVKPFRAPELRCAIEVALSRHRAEKVAVQEHSREIHAELARAVARGDDLEAFSYSVAHDLRAPLRGISGFSEILALDHAAELGTEGLEHLNTVRRAARRMHLMIEDLLRMSKTSRDVLTRGTADLSRIARDALDRLRAAEPHRSVTADIADDVVVAGDAGLLGLVLENLLGNAWKFTSARADARIEFGTLRQGDALVCFVRDNGAGFDPDGAPRLFSAFQRLHPASEFEGTGLGLAIARRIIERHGGRIWAKGAVDAGATFYFAF